MPTYATAPARQLHSTGTDVYVHWTGDSSVSCLPRHVHEALVCCEVPRELEAHATALVRTGLSRSQTEAANLVVALADAGVLVRASRTDPEDVPAAIGTVGIVTAGRPALARRCIESIRTMCAREGRRPEIVVIDGSPEGTGLSLRAEELTQDAWPTRVVSQAHVLRLVRHLGNSGVDPSLVRILLAGGSIGANRNVLLLLTAGRPLLMIDDDVVCDTWRSRHYRRGLRLYGHEDPRSAEFFQSRNDAIGSVRRLDADLLEEHERLLGRRVCSLQQTDFANDSLLCPEIRQARLSPRFIIRATMAGIAGDCSIHSPQRLATIGFGPIADALTASPACFELATSSREGHRIAEATSVGHDASLMAYCLGLANDSAIVPFAASVRNEDGLFGRCLSIADPATCFGHLALGVVHDSQRGSSYDTTSFPGVRFTELLGTMLAEHMATVPVTEPSDRVIAMARYFIALGKLPLSDLEQRLVSSWLSLMLREIERCGAKREGPSHIVHGLRQYYEVLAAALTRPDDMLPLSLKPLPGDTHTYEISRQWISTFGQCLMAWSPLWQYARSLDLASLTYDS